MTVTKEQVAERAKELGLTLTEEQIAKHVKDGSLPEKESSEARREELKSKYTLDQLIEMLLETRGEAAERRRENNKLKEQAEALTKEIQGLGDLKTKAPELEAKLKQSEDLIRGMKDGEKKRRELVLSKVPEEKKSRLSYLLDADKISSDQFDSTLELLGEVKSPGALVPSPQGGGEVTLTEEEKVQAARMNLDPKDYKEIMSGRKPNKQPNRAQAQPV